MGRPQPSAELKDLTHSFESGVVPNDQLSKTKCKNSFARLRTGRKKTLFQALFPRIRTHAHKQQPITGRLGFPFAITKQRDLVRRLD